MGRVRVAVLPAVLAVAAVVTAQGDHVAMVPWKVVAAGAEVDAPLILYWVPATREQLRKSDLLVSRDLTLYSSQCVAMRVVKADDTRRLARLGAATLPLVVLDDRRNGVVGRVESEGGEIPLRAVEELVRVELERRASEAEAMLDRARVRIEEGDLAGGAAIYRTVRDQRCVTPRQGKDADRALRKLRRR